MENHIFSAPEPVETEGNRRSWHIHVYRKGPNGSSSPKAASVPIATLLINSESLPPRTRKGKVIWKLPEDGSVPKFGDIERERLWELFKRSKKERRKKLKENQQKQQQTQCESQARSPETNHNGNKAIAIHGGDGLNNDAGDPPPTEHTDSRSYKKAVIGVSPSESVSNLSENQHLPIPPPGFGMAKLSLNDSTPAGDGQCSASLPSSYPADPLLATSPRYIPAHALNQIPLLFTQLLSSGQACEWLRYYAPGAQSCLQLASAQVNTKTNAERLQQWVSLQQGLWECQGYTVQPVSFIDNIPPLEATGLGATALVVCSGRTRQKSELLVFCLTLVLQQPMDTSRQATPLSQHHQGGFQIVNDVLTLTPV